MPSWKIWPNFFKMAFSKGIMGSLVFYTTIDYGL